jgi:transcriptional regulator with XRE-family HTH domain
LRRLSQRDLAATANVPHSTVSRIEAGTCDPRAATLATILAAIGIELSPCISEQRLAIDAEREELIDYRGRHLPPHWEIRPVTDDWLDPWWGWDRKNPKFAVVPTHSYWRRFGRSGELNHWQLAHRWQDAT